MGLDSTVLVGVFYTAGGTFSEFYGILGKGPPVLNLRRKTRTIKQTTMVSLLFITDITKPLEISNWIPHNKNNKEMTEEQLEAMKRIKTMDPTLARSALANTGMELDDALQESMPWTKVTNKKEGNTESSNNMDSTMKKVRVTLTIRSTKNNEFNPAKLHIDMLHKLHKFDESLIVFNTTGDKKVNIESLISATRYKELFKPMEKAHNKGIVTVSILHYIFLTEKPGSCKEAIFPFLKKNKIFIYFNPKPGLEHFTAIRVLFGPNPDYIWRDELADLLIDTMQPEITAEEAKTMGTTEDGKPKIFLSLNIQTIGNSKPTETTTVVLEIRVPTGLERTYTTIIERLYEKSSDEGKVIIPTKLGKFFPYYMKSKLPDIFTFLMRKQNAEMMGSMHRSHAINLESSQILNHRQKGTQGFRSKIHPKHLQKNHRNLGKPTRKLPYTKMRRTRNSRDVVYFRISTDEFIHDQT
jgi:hypothetical protein